jgi:hypothetical protein
MPSVFTVEGARCPWMLKKGRKFKGCYDSERAARRAAGGGWKVAFSRPPGVPMGSSEAHQAIIDRLELHGDWALDVAQRRLEDHQRYLRRNRCDEALRYLMGAKSSVHAAWSLYKEATNSPLYYRNDDAVDNVEKKIRAARNRFSARCLRKNPLPRRKR